MAADFKLGPALVGAPDTEHVPDPFRLALLRDYLDSPSHLAVALTSKTSLLLMLNSWREARLKVPVKSSSSESPGSLSKRLQAARRQLSLRQGQPITLCLEQLAQITRDDTWWEPASSTLGADEGHALPEDLTLSLWFRHVPAALIAYTSSKLPTLRSLVLRGSGRFAFPHPQDFPGLRDLTVQESLWDGTVWPTLVPFLTQLTSLSILRDSHTRDQLMGDSSRPYWAETLFQDTSVTTTTLTRLSIEHELQPWLCALLQKRAPALEHVTVRTIREERALHAGSSSTDGTPTVQPRCPWRAVHITQSLRLGELGWLPQPAAGGRLTLQLGAGCSLDLHVSLNDAVSEELSALDVRGLDRCAELLLYCGGDTNAFPILGVSPAEPDSDDDFPFFDSERHTHPKAPVNPLNQPAAIAQALSLLRPLLPPTTKLKLRHAVMSDALAAELTYQATQGWIHMSLDQLIWPAPADVTVTLPRLDTLQVFTPMVTRTNDEGTRVTQSGPLTDAMITTLMRCLTSVDTLVTTSIELQTPLPEGTQYPWRKVRVWGTVQLPAWLEQAQRMGAACSWELSRCEIKLSPEQASSEECLRQIEMLKGLDISVAKGYVTIGRLRREVTEAQQPQILRRSLDFARALKSEPEHLSIYSIGPRWVAIDNVVQELAQLPAWQAISLYMRSPKVPDSVFSFDVDRENNAPVDVNPMSRLLGLLPRSYRRVTFTTDYMHSNELTAFILGAPRDRTEAEPLSTSMLSTA